MQNTNTFNQKQRDAFARMLVQAKQRAQSRFESDYSLDARVEREVAPKLAKEHGAEELIAKIESLYDETEKAEKSLSEMGFDYSHGSALGIRSQAPKAIGQVLREAQQTARQERDLSIRKFDLAILDVITAETADDARKIVEGLL